MSLSLFASVALSVPPAAVTTTGPAGIDGLGTNIHFTQQQPGELDQLRAGGFAVVRMDLAWAHVERTRGTLDFGNYDRLLDDLRDRGLWALLILDYGNPHYDGGLSPHTPEGRAGFAAFCAAAAERYAGRAVAWEIWNEPNLQTFWKPTPSAADYVSMAIEACRAIRAADPQAFVVGPATSGIDLHFLEACFQGGLLEHWNAVTVHPYRQTDPETAEPEYRALRALIRRHTPAGKAIPIWSGEWGYSSVWADHTEQRQAERLPRQWLVNLSQGIPVSIWYDWRDDGPDPKEAEHHFGTVRQPHSGDPARVFEPKPAYLAAKALTTALAGATFNKRIWTGDERDWVLLFGAGGSPQIAAWTRRDDGSTGSLAADGEFDVTGHLGEPLPPIESADGRLTIPLTRHVKYLSPRGSCPKLTELLAAEAWPVDRLLTAPATVDGVRISRGDDGRRVVGGPGPQASVVVLSNPVRLQAQPLDAGRLRLVVGGTNAVTVVADPAASIGEWSDIDGARQCVLQWAEVPPEVEVTLVDPSDGESMVRWRGSWSPIALDPSGWLAAVDGDPDKGSTVALAVADDLPPDHTAGGLRLDYGFKPGWQFAAVLPVKPTAIPVGTTHIGFFVRNTGVPNPVRVRFVDAGGEVFQWEGRPTAAAGQWAWMKVPLNAQSSSHWGGDGNGRVDLPITINALFLLDNATRQDSTGQLSVTDAVFIRESTASPRTDRPVE